MWVKTLRTVLDQQGSCDGGRVGCVDIAQSISVANCREPGPQDLLSLEERFLLATYLALAGRDLRWIELHSNTLEHPSDDLNEPRSLLIRLLRKYDGARLNTGQRKSERTEKK